MKTNTSGTSLSDQWWTKPVSTIDKSSLLKVIQPKFKITSWPSGVQRVWLAPNQLQENLSTESSINVPQKKWKFWIKLRLCTEGSPPKLNSMMAPSLIVLFTRTPKVILLTRMTSRQLRDTSKSCRKVLNFMELSKSMSIGSSIMSSSQERSLKRWIYINFLKMLRPWAGKTSKKAMERTALQYIWLSIIRY